MLGSYGVALMMRSRCCPWAHTIHGRCPLCFALRFAQELLALVEAFFSELPSSPTSWKEDWAAQ